MNVIACYKIVPNEQDIVIRPDQTISFDKAEWEIGQYDLPAVEAGMQIAEATGGKLTALSIGTKKLENSKLKKGILSRGPQDVYMVIDDELENVDTYQTAATLAGAVSKIGAYDLVVCGEGSSDLYAQQVGPQLGELLNLPVINAVSNIVADGHKILVERTLENEVEVLEISLPAVVCVTTDICEPRIPTMKEILAAGKKTAVQWSLNDLEIDKAPNTTDILSTLAPKQTDRKKIILDGDSEENIGKLCDYLRREL